MNVRVLFALKITLLFPALAVAQENPASPSAEFFESRVRPVLTKNCYNCHTQSEQGGLRLDSKERLLKGGKSGPAIVPGKPEESLLIRAIKQTEERLKMPLGGKLKPEEIEDLASWIRMGTPWPAAEKLSLAATITEAQRGFWSFCPLARPSIPAVKNTQCVKSAVDNFILSKLEDRGLKPVEPADKRTLIRRATLDLTGLPPKPDEVEAFLKDTSPNAFAKVVDRLLVSPHYGERWGRYWLDIARYGEDDVRGSMDPPKPAYPNAWRYRDWVIEALNRDMPYDLFVKAQLAGDLLPDRDQLVAGLGFFGLGPWYYDTADALQGRANERNDRVDALTRGFFGLTVACARCHDHKYDPLSMQDYYAMAGVFANTEYQEIPLVSQDVVAHYKRQEKKVKAQEAALKEFVQSQSNQLGVMLASQTSDYLMASWRVLGVTPADVKKVAAERELDSQTLENWVKYLGNPKKDHGYLKAWNDALGRKAAEPEVRRIANEFQSLVLSVVAEKKEVDVENRVLLADVIRRKKNDERLFPNAFMTQDDVCEGCSIPLKSLARDRFVLWRELLGEKRQLNDRSWSEGGILYYPEGEIERFLSGEWKKYLESIRTDLENAKKSLPSKYPYLHVIADTHRIANLKLHLRGSPYNLGDEVPRRFLTVLSTGEPEPFTQGSGRLELATAIASHPLTARVIVNRVWKYHFGRGIVGTLSNFGQLGERPTHPELLEYLSCKFVENNFSLKSLHREIMLSATYQLSSRYSSENYGSDPDNRLLWRAHRQRLDIEAIRDSILSVSGSLDPSVGGSSFEDIEQSRRRSVYARISRAKLNELLTLFDFADPSISSEQRNMTNVPLQRLFFLNSELISREAKLLAGRLVGRAGIGTENDAEGIRQAYRLLYGREATVEEISLGLEFLAEQGKQGSTNVIAWQQYAQVLLSSNEFIFVD
jgi:mono/diheme cytochrome c family protein